LNDTIQEEIDYLSELEPTKENDDRIISLQKLLRGELQKRGPLPPVPDF
jgi:hypothetical protein